MKFIRHIALAVLFVVSLSAQASTTIETPNGTFPLIDQGTGPAVLLLHGFPDSKDVWKHQIPALTEAGFRVIAPDLRGYGDAPSPMTKEAYAIPVLMSDVIGMLDALGLDKVYLVGHDWGAGLSWQLASFFQHRFNSMIVLSVGPPDVPAWSSIEQRRMSWYFYLFLQEGLAEKTLADYDWRLMRQFLESHPEAEQVIERLKQGNQMTTALNWYRGNLQDRLAQPGPTTLLTKVSHRYRKSGSTSRYLASGVTSTSISPKHKSSNHQWWPPISPSARSKAPGTG